MTIPLSRDRIAAVALDLIEKDGLGGLNMRSLAASLGIGTMTLYHYLGGKQELLRCVADLAWSEVATAVKADSWEANARTIATSMHDVAFKYPQTYSLLLSSYPPELLTRVVRELTRSLQRGGFDSDRAEIATHTLLRFVFGWCFVDTKGPIGHRAGAVERAKSTAAFAIALEAVLAGLRTLLEPSIADGANEGNRTQ